MSSLLKRASKYGFCTACTEPHTFSLATKATRCHNCGSKPDDLYPTPYHNIPPNDLVVTSADGWTYCSLPCCDEDHKPRISAAAERTRRKEA